MNISDITGLSKPLTRLIEVVSKGVGCVFEPYLIKSIADAKAYEIQKISNALKVADGISDQTIVYNSGGIQIWRKPEDSILNLQNVPVEGRAQSRLDFQQRKRQMNIEKVVSEAAKNLLNSDSVDTKEPDDDWVNRFFTTAQDISSEEMQILWGKILAGEITNIGSYSLRTLDFVRNLTKYEAGVFEKIARLSIEIPGGLFFTSIIDKSWLEKSRDIYQSEQFLLGETGLMNAVEVSFFAFKNAQKKTGVADCG